MNSKVEKRFKDLVYEVCARFDIEVLALECDKDHTHIFLRSIPGISPSEIMAKIKGFSSRKLRGEFSHLSYQKSLWTRSFFVSTAGKVSSKTIQRYIDEQKKRG